MSYPGIHSRAEKAAFISECRTYYRSIYEAIQNAQRSVFIIGWDIDSRIELLRGDDRPDPEKSYSLLNVIAEKARDNPDMQFYLNKWDPAIIYAREREAFSRFKWHSFTPDNVHMCLDGVIASGGSHHQKIIVIDDRIAFCGGMDIALGRWDTPEHFADNPLREDPIGKYGPYHDFQILLEGDAVRELAGISRWRWKRSAGFDALPFKKGGSEVWPKFVSPAMFDFPLIIAQTFPEMEDVKEPKREIEHVILENIRKAEKFIYIENQYLAYMPIAKALNQELRKKPDLRVLIVSSYNPQGPIEKEVMWQGRIKFRKTLVKDIPVSQARMVYPVSKGEDGREEPIRIHAKMIVIDDRYLHIGSANMNGRSMGYDSECDIICIAETEKHKEAIINLRNQYIEKFSGTTIEDEVDFNRLLFPEKGTHLAVHEIDDYEFAEPLLGNFAHEIADKPKPVLPDEIDPGSYKAENIPAWRKNIYRITISVLTIILLILAWHLLNQPGSVEWIREKLEWLFAHNGRSWSSLVIVTAVYTILTTSGFPVTVLIALTATIYGPLYGFLFAITAAMIAAATAFGIGRLAGRKFIRALFGPKLNKINTRIERTGVMQLALLRMVPIAPYGVFNLVSGVSSIKLLPFITGTLLGMLPGTFALAILGDSLAQIIAEASLKNIAYLAFAISVWIGLVYMMHKLVNHLQKRKQRSE